MKTLNLAKFAASALIMGIALVEGGATGTTTAQTAPAAKKLAATGAKWAARASKAIAQHRYDAAVTAAETAVGAMPGNADYRSLLGQAYLGAGRLASAETSFTDTLHLMPDNGRAALNLALVQVGLGKPDAARTTLADYHDKIDGSDYGLALALAGDADGGVAALEAVARMPSADAKVRQNLALVYALAGKWGNSRVMAGQDLSPQDADARILEWAQFVRPHTPSDQVATLLGIKPVTDSGQPSALALRDMPETARSDAPVAPVAVAPEPVAYEAPPAPEIVAVTAPVIHAPATPIKQLIVPKAKPAPAFAAAPKPRAHGVEAGKFVVQLGAFASGQAAQTAWSRAAGKFGLSDYTPVSGAAKVRHATLTRVSVGGFNSRGDAAALCARIQKAGGSCFVRSVSGDVTPQWVQRGMPKMASR